MATIILTSWRRANAITSKHRVSAVEWVADALGKEGKSAKLLGRSGKV
jgi:hypothetical protein